MKKIFIFILLILSSVSLFCLDPINPEAFSKKAKLSLSVGKKIDSLEWAVNDSVPVFSKISYPYLIKYLTIDFGNGDSKTTVSFETAPNNDTTIKMFCLYRSPGKKLIKGTVIHKENGVERKDSLMLEIGIKPEIKNKKTIQKSTEIPKKGQKFSLWIEAEGSEPLYYQWFCGKDSIISKTQNQLTFNSLSSADEGTYAVKVRNKYGTDNSEPSVLSITNNTNKPKINQHPLDVQITINNTAEFKISAEGVIDSYQWQENKKNIPNTSDSILRFGPVTSADSGKIFRCIARNTHGSDTSKEAFLKVLKQEQKPDIETQPEDQQVSVGQIAQFSIKVGGTNLTFEWSRNGAVLEGAKTNTYQTSPVSIKDSGSIFQCKVSNSLGSITSRAAKLIVTSSEKPIIIKQPEDIQISENSSARFSIVATGQNLTYQWLRNSNDISGATSSGYEISAVQKSDNGALFSCRLTNKAGSIKSREAQLKVMAVDNKKKPKITNSPRDTSLSDGDTAIFQINYLGDNIRFVWQENKKDLPESNSIIYSIYNASVEKNGSLFRCIITNEFGSDTSSEAKLLVNEISPKITTTFQSSLLEPQKSCSLSLHVKGGNCTYVWFKDSKEIKSSKEPFLSFASPTASDIGSYYVTISNSKGQVVSDTIYCALLNYKIKTEYELSNNCRLTSVSTDDAACFDAYEKQKHQLLCINPYTNNTWTFFENAIFDYILGVGTFYGKIIHFPMIKNGDTTISIIFFSSDGSHLGEYKSNVTNYIWNGSAVTKNGNVLFKLLGDLYCLNSTTFQKLWVKKSDSLSFQKIAIAKNGTIGYLATSFSSSYVQFLNSSGNTISTVNLKKEEGATTGGTLSQPIFDENGNLYVDYAFFSGTNPNKPFVQKINTSGQILWSITIPETNSELGKLIAPRNKLLLIDVSGTLYSIDANSGSIEWKKDRKTAGYISISHFNGILNDENLYFLQRNHVNLNSLDGKYLGSIRLPEGGKTCTYWLSHKGDIFICRDKSNEIYGVKTNASAPAQTSWPIIGADLQQSNQAQ